jgi:hypothetical protein
MKAMILARNKNFVTQPAGLLITQMGMDAH